MGGLIYIVAIEDDYRRCKVGRTTNAAQRLSSLRTGSADELHMMWSRAVPNATEAERAVHRALAPFRIRNEWFGVGWSDAASVALAVIESRDEAVAATVYYIEQARHLLRHGCSIEDIRAARRLREAVRAEHGLIPSELDLARERRAKRRAQAA